MNHLYDHNKAKAIVESLYEGHQGSAVSGVNVVQDVELDHTTFQKVECPPSVRMLHVQDGEEAEVVMKAYGVLCGASLPPVTRPPRVVNSTRIRNLRQHVKITAFGSHYLLEALAHLSDVQSKLRVHVKGDVSGGMEFLPYEGSPCLESHARYFTDRRLVPYEKSQGFPRNIDLFDAAVATRGMVRDLWVPPVRLGPSVHIILAGVST
ncbi:hypothetical protein MD484_g8352, partial [Candolleomyces efflorescens]